MQQLLRPPLRQALKLQQLNLLWRQQLIQDIVDGLDLHENHQHQSENLLDISILQTLTMILSIMTEQFVVEESDCKISSIGFKQDQRSKFTVMH